MSEQTETPWKIFAMNDCDWWLSRSEAEAIETYQQHINDEGGDFGIVTELNQEDLNRLQFIDEGHDLMEPSQWQCECGEKGDAMCRWNGFAYEHHHGYPIGHVMMECSTKRSFQEELSRRVKEGIENPTIFASTEY